MLEVFTAKVNWKSSVWISSRLTLNFDLIDKFGITARWSNLMILLIEKKQTKIIDILRKLRERTNEEESRTRGENVDG